MLLAATLLTLRLLAALPSPEPTLEAEERRPKPRMRSPVLLNTLLLSSRSLSYVLRCSRLSPAASLAVNRARVCDTLEGDRSEGRSSRVLRGVWCCDDAPDALLVRLTGDSEDRSSEAVLAALAARGGDSVAASLRPRCC